MAAIIWSKQVDGGAISLSPHAFRFIITPRDDGTFRLTDRADNSWYDGFAKQWHAERKALAILDPDSADPYFGPGNAFNNAEGPGFDVERSEERPSLYVWVDEDGEPSVPFATSKEAHDAAIESFADYGADYGDYLADAAKEGN